MDLVWESLRENPMRPRNIYRINAGGRHVKNDAGGHFIELDSGMIQLSVTRVVIPVATNDQN